MTELIRNGTPLETHHIRGREILVKREDLCCPLPGPSFSKMRGVVAHIKSRPENVIGVLDTYHSKAGQAVAYACASLGKQCVNFWPKFKADEELKAQKGGFIYFGIREGTKQWFPRIQQGRAAELGAHMVSLPAGRSAILYHQAKKKLAAWSNSYMMPNALKLSESIRETSDEVVRTAGVLPINATYVISMSSGTVASGVIHGLRRISRGVSSVYLHAGYSRSEKAVTSYVATCLGVETPPCLLNAENLPIFLNYVDEGFNYRDRVPNEGIPFPCNEFYDAKAWRWLTQNVEKLGGGPIVFWNIGD